MLFAIVCAYSAPASAQRVRPGDSCLDRVRPGYVGMVELGLFASDALRPACDKLLRHDLLGAGADFRAVLAQSPTDQVAWLGLVQADAEFRGAELKRLRSASAVDRGTAFRKGVLELYDWGSRQFNGSALEAIQGVAPCREILRTAWDNGRGEILYGVLYTETWIVVPESSSAPLRTTDQMMQKVLPSRVWAGYRKHQASRHWPDDPPAADDTPQADRRLLFAVLGTRWTFLTTRVQTFDLKRPQILRGPPREPSVQLEADYLQRWYRGLKRAF